IMSNDFYLSGLQQTSGILHEAISLEGEKKAEGGVFIVIGRNRLGELGNKNEPSTTGLIGSLTMARSSLRMLEREKLAIEKINDELEEEYNNWELTLEVVNELKKMDAYTLVQEGITGERGKHFEFYKAIDFRIRILQEAREKLQKAREEVIDATNDIDDEFAKIRCQVPDEDLNMLRTSDIFAEFKDLVEKDSKVEQDFDLQSIDKLIAYQNVLDNLLKKKVFNLIVDTLPRNKLIPVQIKIGQPKENSNLRLLSLNHAFE
ncbi:hypothetical protein KI387_018970, partial [Taxus chinensis]